MDSCKHCNVVLDSRQGDYVCTDCGLVVENLVTDNDVATRGLGYRRQSKYKRLYHFNERLSQLCLQESSIPVEHMKMIAEAAQTMITQTGLVADAESDAYKERVRSLVDKPFIQRALKMAGGVAFTKKYLEKWLSIRRAFLGDMPTPLGAEEIEHCRRLFLLFEDAFHLIRSKWNVRIYRSAHTTTLDKWFTGSNRTARYKTFQQKKRQHIPNLNFVMRFIFIQIDRTDLLRFLPLMKDHKKVREHERILNQICRENDWQFRSVLYEEDIKRFTVA